MSLAIELLFLVVGLSGLVASSSLMVIMYKYPEALSLKSKKSKVIAQFVGYTLLLVSVSAVVTFSLSLLVTKDSGPVLGPVSIWAYIIVLALLTRSIVRVIWDLCKSDAKELPEEDDVDVSNVPNYLSITVVVSYFIFLPALWLSTLLEIIYYFTSIN